MRSKLIIEFLRVFLEQKQAGAVELNSLFSFRDRFGQPDGRPVLHKRYVPRVFRRFSVVR
jgi:hypothetical protein